MSEIFPASKKIIFLVILLFVILLGILLLKINTKNETPTSLPPVIINSPVPTPSTQLETTPNKFQLKTNVGTTTDQQLLKLNNIASISATLNGKTQYVFKPTPQMQNNTVITQDGVVVFEKGTPILPGLKLQNISDYNAMYGEPERILTGSKRYGKFEETYIYAKQGFVLVGNPFTDEVDEVQIFIPQTVAEYLKNWGQDIDPNIKTKETF